MTKPNDDYKAKKDTTATKGKLGGAAVKELRKLNSPIIKVSVSQECIDTSCRENSGHCMVSDAVKECVPWARNISSDLQTIRLTDPRKGLRYIYLTPRIAQFALIEFDKGNAMVPFEFTLRGAHITTSFKRVTLPDGKVKKERVHKLGRKRVATLSPSKVRDGVVPGIIGGEAPPLPPSSTFRREYGMRAYTSGFDIKKMPVGAPSVSDK